MRALLALAALIIGAHSITWTVSVLTHLIVLVLCALPLWYLDVTLRPERYCRWCDKGKNWDTSRQHYGRFCPGWLFGWWSCRGAGAKLRWEIRALRMVGVARRIPDPKARDD